MTNLIAWWARNSVAANLVMVGIFVAGIIGFTSMEREMSPQLRLPVLQIRAYLEAWHNRLTSCGFKLPNDDAAITAGSTW